MKGKNLENFSNNYDKSSKAIIKYFVDLPKQTKFMQDILLQEETDSTGLSFLSNYFNENISYVFKNFEVSINRIFTCTFITFRNKLSSSCFSK